jgi:putative heme-binding domain-containing protein
MKHARFLVLSTLSLSTCAIASGAQTSTTKPATLPPGVSAPAGFDVTLYAHPPDVNYPTCLTAKPNGDLLVGIDEQGSLGKESGKGRVVLCVDTDHDGVADKITTFAMMDHPRGVVWDDAANALYVLHPPTLTRYDDDNNDGVADRETTIVAGCGNEKVQVGRGADHTCNGIRMGIDGWIYIAMGDFGAPDAVGTDGTHLQMHGGGILRVRPDGSGLEKYVTGTRNIYDVAIDPLMNVFTRDNTNDGDGWNDRLAYDVPSGYYGYPSKFRNFPGEFIDCMIDFGGGSPCGSLFLDEPGLPPNLGHGLYTVEWGLSEVDRHPLTPDGAGFKATTEKLMDLPRGIDIDADGASNLYVCSWANGGFTYTGPDVGFVLKLAPKGYTAPAFPNLAKASNADLVKYLAATSGVLRQAAQREIVHRGYKREVVEGLIKLAKSDTPLAGRSAAIFTLKLIDGDRANDALVDVAKNPDVRELALRALVDRKDDSTVNPVPLIAGLRDENPRVRLISAWGIARLGKKELAPQILPLTNDTDPLVSQVAINGIVSLKAIQPAMKDLSPGALKALKQIHDVAVVEGLTHALANTQDATKRGQILGAICRLYFDEAEWDGTWWNTRPDTTGPYYKPVEWSGTPAARNVIEHALSSESEPVLRTVLLECAANRIDLPEANQLLSKFAANDPSFREVILKAWQGRSGLTDQQIATVQQIAESSKDPAIRVRAIRVLSDDSGNASTIEAVVPLLAKIMDEKAPSSDLSAEIDSFLQHGQTGKRRVTLSSIIAKSDSPAERELCYAAILGIVRDPAAGKTARANATKAIAKAWDDSANATAVLRAIARMKADTFADDVRSHLASSNTDIAKAARDAAAALGLNKPTTQAGTIAALGFDKTVAETLAIPGDATLGKELFKAQGCVNCHTVTPDQPPKGPFLGGISTRYKRAELCESVMKPSAKIAQGFETQWFKTKDDIVEGFVTRESGDEVEFRTVTGATTVLKKSDIKSRGKRDISVMPEGLVAKLTPKDLANLIAYLESLKAK